jgi:ribose-phosphate pyrophosphokinase
MIILNGHEVKSIRFPNGESLINTKDLRVTMDNTIVMKFQNDADLMTLIFLANHIDELGYSARLIMPYMPYSRMDRTENHKTVFTLKYICKVINDLLFDEVIIYEPH